MSTVAPVMASVIVLAVQDFARMPVAEQGRIKAEIESLARRALQAVADARRVVLDAPQGLAVAFLDHPAAALDFAERVQAGAGKLALCISANCGPVTVAGEPGRGMGLAGDGIAAGMTLAQVAAPGRLVASRPFLEALQAEAPGSAARLAPAGQYTDAHVRTHELYTLDQRATRARRLRYATTGVVLFLAILALGAVARMALFGSEIRLASAVIEFQVTPGGDIYIDDVLKGSTPPIQRIEIAPGPHTIEVRQSGFPPLRVEVNPGPAEQLTLSHAFVARAAKSKARARQPGVGDSVRQGWRDFRRSVGF